MSKQYPIVIFSANEETNDYSTQGEGLLTDITFGKVTGGLTDATSLQMQYPINGVNADLIEENKILLTKINEFQDNQRMRITSVKKSLNGRMYDIKAEPIFNDIRRYFVPEVGNKEVVTDPQGAWNLLKAAAVPPVPSRFTYLSDLTSEGRFFIQSANVLEALGGTDGSLLDTFGGEYIRDNNTLHAYKQFGDKNVSYLTYGKNIEGLDMEVNIENIVIGIFPYVSRNVDGVDKLITLDEKILKYDTGDTFPNGRIEPVDFSENFEDDVTPTQDQIRALATTYMNQAVNSEKSKPLINVKVDFLELSHYSEYYDFQQLVRIGLGDVVNIYYPPMNVDVESRVIKYEYDMVKGQYSKLELGKVKANFYTKLQDNIKDVEDQINNDVDFSGIYDAIDDAIQDASDKITGNQGGNVVLSPSTMPEEILIMDTADKATAKDVLRLNKSGIGFSRDGYNGTYKTAWTIDGQFNADYITAGTLRAINIQGVKISGSVFESAGADFTIRIDNGTISFIKKSDNTTAFTMKAQYPSAGTANSVGFILGDRQGTFSVTKAGDKDFSHAIFFSDSGFSVRNQGKASFDPYWSISSSVESSSPKNYGTIANHDYSSGNGNMEISQGNGGKNTLVWLRDGGMKVALGSFSVTGTKNSEVTTDRFGTRLLNAYETPEYLFATYGKVTTDDSGYAEVIIDPVFLETINTDSKNYHVFLSPYADTTAWVSYLEKDRFMVNTGKPNIEVSWNLVAYRLDYEDFYLETPKSNSDKYQNIVNKKPATVPDDLQYLTGGMYINEYPLTDVERQERQLQKEAKQLAN